GKGMPKGEAGFDHRFFYGRFDGKQWNVNEMAYAGTRLYRGEDDYTGLAMLDPGDPDIVYISTNAIPTTSAPLISSVDNQRHHELFRGKTAALPGATCSRPAATTGASIAMAVISPI